MPCKNILTQIARFYAFLSTFVQSLFKSFAMKTTTLHRIFFSATGTTMKIVNSIGLGSGIEKVEEHSLMFNSDQEVKINSDEIALFGVPVYSGRVPEIVAERLRMFRGDTTPAIIVVVYGNRDFDDALLELRDIVESRGFKVISAGAFVAQHSIFPKIGQGRPNIADLLSAEELGRKSIELLSSSEELLASPTIEVCGNSPYRSVSAIPLKPKASRKCNSCGTCAKQCPVGAIYAASLRKTDKNLCISCAHCIAVCPQKARSFKGLLYRLAAKKFSEKFMEPKTAYITYK